VIRTFLDSGVLIAAARATGVQGTRALALFNDPDRVFVSSEFVRMEVFPKAIYFKRQAEVGFYEDFFASVAQIVALSASLMQLAYTEACQSGLSGLDALHIAAAKFSGSEEFITTERPTKPIFRVTGIIIKTLATP
jgi:predicted nucleic acid-binding protein